MRDWLSPRGMAGGAWFRDGGDEIGRFFLCSRTQYGRFCNGDHTTRGWGV